MYKVSNIVPVYNAEKYLNSCIKSLLNQTLKDTEIILINDGSTDRSLEIMRYYQSFDRSRIKVYTQANAGTGAARNVGLANATGQYISFVDADDYLDKDCLEKMYTTAKERKVKIVRGNFNSFLGPFKLMDSSNWSGLKGNQMIDTQKNKDYIVKETVAVTNKLISRELIGDLKFPENMKWEDISFIPPLLAEAKQVYHLDEKIYNYRGNINTTVRDFIIATPKVIDVISGNELLEKNMKDRGIAELYHKQLESHYVLHTIYRVQNVMFWPLFPKKNKKDVISSLMNFVELKYPNWRNNHNINEYRQINSSFNRTIEQLSSYVDEKNYISDGNLLKKKISQSFK